MEQISARLANAERAIRILGANQVTDDFSAIIKNSVVNVSVVEDVAVFDPYNYDASDTAAPVSAYAYFRSRLEAPIQALLTPNANSYSQADYQALKQLSMYSTGYGTDHRRIDKLAKPRSFDGVLYAPDYGIPGTGVLASRINALMSRLRTCFRSASNGQNASGVSPGVSNKIHKWMNMIRVFLIAASKFSIPDANQVAFVGYVGCVIGYKAVELYSWLDNVALRAETTTPNGETFRLSTSNAYLRKLANSPNGNSRMDLIVVHSLVADFDSNGVIFTDGNNQPQPRLVRTISRFLVEPDAGVTLSLFAQQDSTVAAIPQNLPAYNVEEGMIIAIYSDVSISNLLFASAEKKVYSGTGNTVEDTMSKIILMLDIAVKPDFMSDKDYFQFFVLNDKQLVTSVRAFASAQLANSMIKTSSPSFLSEIADFFKSIVNEFFEIVSWIEQEVGKVLEIIPPEAVFLLA